MQNPPKVCEQCEKLKIISVYMGGKCDYACGYPVCEHREAYRQAEQKEREGE